MIREKNNAYSLLEKLQKHFSELVKMPFWIPAKIDGPVLSCNSLILADIEINRRYPLITK